MSAIAANVMHFSRLLRRAGMPVGTGKIMTALRALSAIDLSRREDVFCALHAVLVERHSQSKLFQHAFERFWQAGESGRDDDGPVSRSEQDADALPESPIFRRVDNASGAAPAPSGDGFGEAVGTAQLSWSSAENLRMKDFEAMTVDEAVQARRLIAGLRLPIPSVPTRRFHSSSSGSRIDMRNTLRNMLRTGDATQLKYRRRRFRDLPVVALCDISGSMAAYSRMLLHFLHAITNDRDRVHVFLFGTRLTNVTRELAHADPDMAITTVGQVVRDWSGGTRIGSVLRDFNRFWGRRVLGQGAVVLLISDGLDRDGGAGLAKEMQRLQMSCRRLIWLNPLLRYGGFEPKSSGIRAMLPFVDDFRPVHNLDSLTGIVAALQDRETAHRAPLRRAERGTRWPTT